MSGQEDRLSVIPEALETSIVSEPGKVAPVSAVQSADEVVENFFEGLDEDSFIAELQVVSAWSNGKRSENPAKSVTNEADAPQKTLEAPSSDMSDAVKLKPTLNRKPTNYKKPVKGNDSNSYEKESALDRFKSFLPDGADTKLFNFHANNKRYQNYVDKPESKIDLGVRRDPDKTKRDIEKDKQNKNKETLIKKMETGLIPPGMEMEIDNSAVNKRVITKRKDSPSPKRIKSPSREENYRRRPVNDYVSRSRYYKRSTNRSPSYSPDRNSRHDRRSSRSSRSSRNDRISSERRPELPNIRRISPYICDRPRIRPNKKSRKSRASIEMELLANIPVQYPVRAPAPAPVISYPPPVPVPAPTYDPSYSAPPYAVEGSSFNIETSQGITTAAAFPNMTTPQDYYAPGYSQSYNTTFNPEVMPPESYSDGYVNNYSIPPPTDTAYANAGCNNYDQSSSSYATIPATDVYSAFGNTLERDKVIRDCEKVVAELNTPHLPTHVYYSSPLNRKSGVNYSYTSANKNSNVSVLLPVITSTLEEKVGIKTNDVSFVKNTRDVAVQTKSFSCDQCQLHGAFRQEDKSVNTTHRLFMASVHSQVTEEDLASSKIVFMPNQKATAAEDPKPVSLTHMTPAQILADLKAKTKNMQRSLVDTYRQSGGKIEDFPSKQMNHRANLYQKSNLLNHNKSHNSSWKN